MVCSINFFLIGGVCLRNVSNFCHYYFDTFDLTIKLTRFFLKLYVMCICKDATKSPSHSYIDFSIYFFNHLDLIKRAEIPRIDERNILLGQNLSEDVLKLLLRKLQLYLEHRLVILDLYQFCYTNT